MDDDVVLPAPCLVVLVGPSGAGKTTWATAHFRPEQIVGSDRLRAVVGESEDDLRASDDAFALLEQIVQHRVRRRLTTVVDTLGLAPARRQEWVALARRHDVAVAAVVFEASAAECRARNRARRKSVPERVIAAHVRQLGAQRDAIDSEGFDAVIAPAVVRTVTARVARSGPLVREQREQPVGLQFGLQIGAFPGDASGHRDRLRAIAVAAEEAGFASIWVMDHLRQIPQVGRAWDDMLESYTTLAYLAGVTERVQLGALVTGITYRNVAHLGKIVATLDVLSGGRAVCGLGLAWFEQEHRAYGWEFPPADHRYALLEDALQLLPQLWGKGAPAYRGRIIDVPEAQCYPRPLQAHVPILVGGNGERRTLRLAAQYADACNVIGDVDVVERKVAVLHMHCDTLGRAHDAVAVTQLSTALVGRDDAEVAAAVDRLRPRRVGTERFAASVNAGTVADQIGRFRALADAGVTTSIVRLADLDGADAIERFAPVVEAFAVAP